ncbi:MAG TPA: flagellar hook protein FlgE [Caulobacteraceae bacterium]|nr:flagellar hook protein FlgE [Caulobacteraceae bacterium]
MNPISAIAGISNATARFELASQSLLESVSGLSDDDPAQAIVEQLQAKAQLKASVQTLRVADEMTATLLDIIA